MVSYEAVILVMLLYDFNGTSRDSGRQSFDRKDKNCESGVEQCGAKNSSILSNTNRMSIYSKVLAYGFIYP